MFHTSSGVVAWLIPRHHSFLLHLPGCHFCRRLYIQHGNSSCGKSCGCLSPSSPPGRCLSTQDVVANYSEPYLCLKICWCCPGSSAAIIQWHHEQINGYYSAKYIFAVECVTCFALFLRLHKYFCSLTGLLHPGG